MLNTTAEKQPNTEARCAHFREFPPLKSDRCEPSALWVDGLSSWAREGWRRRGCGVFGEAGGVVAAPEERMRGGETVGESGLVGAAGSL